VPGGAVTFEEFDGHDLPEFENPHHRVQAGIPSMALDRMTRWYGGEDGGHIGFSCAMPIAGKDGCAIRDLARGVLNERGLDYSAAIIVGRRSMIHVALVVFDTKNEAQARGAYAAVKAMLEPAARLGYGEYRSHVDFMDEVAALYDYNANAQRRFAERIKDTLDPNGILSPGKQGIWPRAYRTEGTQ
jgi:4-cresol dehydrogenase (hydroxylating)